MFGRFYGEALHAPGNIADDQAIFLRRYFAGAREDEEPRQESRRNPEILRI